MSKRDELIQGLNKDLMAEWGTIIRYTHQSGKAFGIAGVELREILTREIQDELRHATFLTDVIVDLGGEPATMSDDFAKPNDLKGMLELDLQREEQDVENYKKHAKLSEELGEIELKVKLEEIASDEERHARVLRRLLKGM